MQRMLTAKEAKTYVICSNMHIWNDICADILGAIADRRFECVWYSNPFIDLNEFNLEVVDLMIRDLEDLGYTVEKKILEPKEYFKTTRIRLKISWENV